MLNHQVGTVQILTPVNKQKTLAGATRSNILTLSEGLTSMSARQFLLEECLRTNQTF